MGTLRQMATQVKPLVSMVVHEVVNDVNRHLYVLSKGEVVRRITYEALTDAPTLNRLAPYMWRDFTLGDHTWVGHSDPDDLSALLPDAWTRAARLVTRFDRMQMGRLSALAFAFGIDVTNTVAVLLRAAIDDERVLRLVAPGYVYRPVEKLRRGVIRKGGV